MSKSVPVGNAFPDPFKIEVDMFEGRSEPQMIRSASKKSMGAEEVKFYHYFSNFFKYKGMSKKVAKLGTNKLKTLKFSK